jgi:putative alpha-1,2-mannosidase
VLNGHPLDRAFLRHEEILAGGTLRFTMQATPNREWGTHPSRQPYSMSAR